MEMLYYARLAVFLSASKMLTCILYITYIGNSDILLHPDKLFISARAHTLTPHDETTWKFPQTPNSLTDRIEIHAVKYLGAHFSNCLKIHPYKDQPKMQLFYGKIVKIIAFIL